MCSNLVVSLAYLKNVTRHLSFSFHILLTTVCFSHRIPGWRFFFPSTMSRQRDAEWRVLKAAREFMYGADEDDSEDNTDSEEDETEPTPPDDKTVAAIVDKAFADAEETAFFEKFKLGPIRVDITSADPAWQVLRRSIQDALNLVTSTPSQVLDAYLTPAQKLLLLPPLYAGDTTILEIQKYNTQLYKEALATGGDFEGQNDNLITKIAMARFGLPVEPLTVNNVYNTGTDGNDPEDADPAAPRVQRIMFAEKPLEFLDKYYERSHGYPMIRREYSRITASTKLC